MTKGNAPEREMTEFQEKCAATIRKYGEGIGGVSITELACRVRSNRLAVSSAMRSLEKRGFAGQYRSGCDQWAAQIWFMREDLR